MVSNKCDILNNFLAPDDRCHTFAWELRYRKKKPKTGQFLLTVEIPSVWSVYIEKLQTVAQDSRISV